MKIIITKLLGFYLNILSWVAPKAAARRAFLILCYPSRSGFKPHHKQFLDSSQKFNFNFNDIYIQGYRWGNGSKKILFLHGWRSNSFHWKKYIEALPQDEYTIYAIDAPGHGASGGKILYVPLYSEVIKQFVNSLGSIDVIVSHSMGSFSALHALYISPDLPVGRLVIMASPGKGADFISFFRDALSLSDRTIKLLLKYFEKILGQPIDFFVAAKFASSITIPGLIVHDKEDPEAPYYYAVQIHEAWIGSKLFVTNGLGHNLKSPMVVKEVCNFVMNKSEFVK